MCVCVCVCVCVNGCVHLNWLDGHSLQECQISNLHSDVNALAHCHRVSKYLRVRVCGWKCVHVCTSLCVCVPCQLAPLAVLVSMLDRATALYPGHYGNTGRQTGGTFFTHRHNINPPWSFTNSYVCMWVYLWDFVFVCACLFIVFSLWVSHSKKILDAVLPGSACVCRCVFVCVSICIFLSCFSPLFSRDSELACDLHCQSEVWRLLSSDLAPVFSLLSSLHPLCDTTCGFRESFNALSSLYHCVWGLCVCVVSVCVCVWVCEHACSVQLVWKRRK